MRPYDGPMLRGRSTALTGFAIVVVAASLFGTLGPLSRFAYDAGMEPLPDAGRTDGSISCMPNVT